VNLFAVSLRNLRTRALSSVLTALSVALGTGLLAALWLLIAQTENRYKESLAGYSAVVGPKEGSPLSLVLSVVFNLGAEPGVVPLSVYQELHDGPLGRRLGLRYAIPQARGDHFAGFPVIGTTDEMFGKFSRRFERDDEGGRTAQPLAFAAGGPFAFGHEDLLAFAALKAAEQGKVRESDEHGHIHGEAVEPRFRKAVFGADVARRLGVGVGFRFAPVHGGVDDPDAHVHTESECEVIGVLARTGTPLDRSIFIPLNTFLSMDKHEAIRGSQEASAGSVLLSAIIVDFRHPLGGAHLRREFQTRSEAQVSWPRFEVDQLLQIVGNATDLLRVISYLVLLVGGVSILVALYNTMNERRREIAIMRALGARRGQIVRVILQEAALVALAGAIAGVLACHGAARLAGDAVTRRTSVPIDWTAFTVDELWLILGVTVLGGIAGILPAIKGSMTEVADNIGPVS
jgi:putative ABC transport system permease protein